MKTAIFGSIILIAVMVGVSAYGWANIPEDMMIARHWGLNGEVDGFSPRNHVLIGMPLLGAILAVFFAMVPRIDPRAANVERSRGLLFAGWLGSLALLTVMHAAIIFPAANGEADPGLPGLTLYAVSLLIIIIGNFTAKSRSNFFLGVRTPWTLSSEHAWIAANRTAGWLFVLTGFLAAATGIIYDYATGFKLLTVGVISAALVSVAVSYFAWRADPDRQNI